ncbi:hypothetical protein E1A91_D12G314200v1 [Gossypium mustelinum]|uniref:Uncharacterized protein n=1 Tax=Gossypium mustelinum TaxID=34275 RepID=A0A5D2SL79_GOSMU|nr:hypothetical protein E1A91_D12G314200v1 [Gossypium mustelinum]
MHICFLFHTARCLHSLVSIGYIFFKIVGIVHVLLAEWEVLVYTYRVIDEIKKSRLFVLSSHLTRLPPASSLMASEKVAALAAVPSDSPTIFDKIINKEIPATVVYEDNKPNLCSNCSWAYSIGD